MIAVPTRLPRQIYQWCSVINVFWSAWVSRACCFIGSIAISFGKYFVGCLKFIGLDKYRVVSVWCAKFPQQLKLCCNFFSRLLPVLDLPGVNN